MREFAVVGLLASTLTCIAGGQQPDASNTPSPTAQIQAAHAKSDSQDVPGATSTSSGEDSRIYVVNRDVTAPKFLPVELPLQKTDDCKKKLQGTVVLSFLVDASGVPQSIAFEEGLGNGLDFLAYKILSNDRFAPALRDGAPVTAPMLAELTLDACSSGTPSSAGETQIVKLSDQPGQKFKAMLPVQVELEFAMLQHPLQISLNSSDLKKESVTPPTPKNPVEAFYSDEARRKKIGGVCVVSLIVDTNGMPRNVRVRRPLGYGLDQNAVEAARRYRFKPATKKGQPIPVMIAVEINFRLY